MEIRRIFVMLTAALVAAAWTTAAYEVCAPAMRRNVFSADFRGYFTKN